MSESRRILLQIGLFITTCITTTLAGADFCYNKSIYKYGAPGDDFVIAFNDQFTWTDFALGLQFSIPLLLILTVHEFGHYFMAMYHRVKASLPYYIPFPPIPALGPFIGTMGAIIRIRTRVMSNVQNFDIGLAGPLAGFIVALLVLFYGFTNLPHQDYVFQFHPEYEQYGADYADIVYEEEYVKERGGAMYIYLGSNLLFEFFSQFVADPERVPNPYELMHYPILVAGFISLFFTALNLLPIGQLDGGHITYGLFGKKGHQMIASAFFVLLIFYSGLGMVNIHTDKGVTAGYLPDLIWLIPLAIWFNYFCFQALGLSVKSTFMVAMVVFTIQFLITAIFPTANGFRGWILFGIVIARFLGVNHPPSEIEQPLDAKRIILGWLTLIIFIVCFSPIPFDIVIIMPDVPVNNESVSGLVNY
jgi:membrane-associated protease RseP (regulator of RpoE activity)